MCRYRVYSKGKKIVLAAGWKELERDTERPSAKPDADEDEAAGLTLDVLDFAERTAVLIILPQR